MQYYWRIITALHFFSDQTLYWFVMKDRRSSDPWGHKWCFERHFSWQVVHFQLSNWQGHRWAGLLMISQINQSKPIELRNQELLICYFVFFSLCPTHSSNSVLTMYDLYVPSLVQIYLESRCLLRYLKSIFQCWICCLISVQLLGTKWMQPYFKKLLFVLK